MTSNSPFKITEKSYEKQNRSMRSDYTEETGKKLGKRLTTGKNARRVSFACRFAGMQGAMKDDKGKPTKKAMALKKWGFGSVGAERDDAAHISYLKRDIDYDAKHGHSDKNMTADEKHISKLAGDIHHDSKKYK